MLTTYSPRIIAFYKANPTLDFETVNLFFVDMLEKMASSSEFKNTTLLQNVDEKLQLMLSTGNNNNHFQDKILTELDSVINHCKKMKSVEIPVLLNQLFSTSEVIKQSTINENFDTCVLKRPSKTSIYFGSIDMNRNATTEEIQDFSKVVEEKRCHGIFINQKAGISGKPNYHIDYIHGNVIVYIHQAEYSQEKIKVAIDIIDNISTKLKELNSNHGDCAISKAVLDDINKEYQLFLTQKEAVIAVYKDCQKKVLSQFDEIRFPCLDKYLSTKYTPQPLKHGHKCDLCKSFNANNLKALAAHKRGCARKNIFISNPTTIIATTPTLLSS